MFRWWNERADDLWIAQGGKALRMVDMPEPQASVYDPDGDWFDA